MTLRTISLLSALLVPLAAAPSIALGSSGADANAPTTTPTKPSADAQPQVPPNPAPGTCSTDNSDPNYTCKTCTSAGGGVITITCTPKVKKPAVLWW